MFLLQHYFNASVRRWPDKVAVSCQDDALTFQQLDLQSNRLARWLKASGATRGARVGFFMPKSVYAIVSILGIIKADCSYVPIDVKSPAQRMASIIASAEIDLVLVNNQSSSLLDGMDEARQTVTSLNVEHMPQLDHTALAAENLSIDLAYVLFTSGSTGQPKGVMITHGAIIDYVSWCISQYQLTANDAIANHAPLYFDNSTFDIYTALFTGATLHLVDDDLNAVLPRLVKWLDDRAITTLFCVPSVLTLLQKSRRLKPGTLATLRHVIFAGEVVRPDVLAGWIELYPDKQFTNMYGPTEITVDCTFHVVDNSSFDPSVPVPIGRARPNMELFIRLTDGNIVTATNCEGELLVRGASVARGYLANAARTAAAFIPHPDYPDIPERLYCTGDIVRADASGVLQFVGRTDSQIKLLGHRIELGEVEAAVTSVEGVQECIVVFNRDADVDEQHLAALVISDVTAEGGSPITHPFATTVHGSGQSDRSAEGNRHAADP
nr:L-proline--[L-prolyl-carrier protein] ligase-like [Nerophis lumbriciformis]